jgi:hypothetical protein
VAKESVAEGAPSRAQPNVPLSPRVGLLLRSKSVQERGWAFGGFKSSGFQVAGRPGRRTNNVSNYSPSFLYRLSALWQRMEYRRSVMSCLRWLLSLAHVIPEDWSRCVVLTILIIIVRTDSAVCHHLKAVVRLLRSRNNHSQNMSVCTPTDR